MRYAPVSLLVVRVPCGQRMTVAKQATVEWEVARLAKRKELADKEIADTKESPAAAVNAASIPAPMPQPTAEKKGKLLPKTNTHLPRRLKKAQKKAAGLL